MVGMAAVEATALCVGPSALWGSLGLGTWACGPGWYMSGLWPSVAVAEPGAEAPSLLAFNGRLKPPSNPDLVVVLAVVASSILLAALQWSAWSSMARVGPPPWSPMP